MFLLSLFQDFNGYQIPVPSPMLTVASIPLLTLLQTFYQVLFVCRPHWLPQVLNPLFAHWLLIIREPVPIIFNNTVNNTVNNVINHVIHNVINNDVNNAVTILLCFVARLYLV